MYRDQEREGHFISPDLEYPMICNKMTYHVLIPVNIIGYSSSGDIK
jgi:hypothetical protein